MPLDDIQVGMKRGYRDKGAGSRDNFGRYFVHEPYVICPFYYKGHGRGHEFVPLPNGRQHLSEIRPNGMSLMQLCTSVADDKVRFRARNEGR